MGDGPVLCPPKPKVSLFAVIRMPSNAWFLGPIRYA